MHAREREVVELTDPAEQTDASGRVRACQSRVEAGRRVQPSGETKPWRGQDIGRPRARYRPDSPDQYGTDERTSAGRSDHGARPPASTAR